MNQNTNALVAVREQLSPIMQAIEPTLEQLLPPAIPPQRLLQTVYVACSQNPYLMERCHRQTIVQAATTAAVLALEVDNVMGQAYLVPFQNRCQFIGGYKGFVTLAGRGHRTLEGFVIREGDDFECDESRGLWQWRRKLGNESERKLIATCATSRWVQDGSEIKMIRVLSLDQLIERRNNTASWKRSGEKSTWGTNFEPMCRKTPMRDLSKDTPILSMQAAAALETQHDLGRYAWLHPDGGVVVEEPGKRSRELSPEEASAGNGDEPRQPSAEDLLGPEESEAPAPKQAQAAPANGAPPPFPIYYPGGSKVEHPSLDVYEVKMLKSIDKAGEYRAEFERLNNGFVHGVLKDRYPHIASRIVDAFARYE